jgi:hypothetical protein
MRILFSLSISGLFANALDDEGHLRLEYLWKEREASPTNPDE